MSPNSTKPIVRNRRAYRDYDVIDTVEAGIVLTGSEVKSLRAGHVQVADAYAQIRNGEVWLEGVHIAPYQFAHGVGGHDPDRPRKLLMHRGEIERLDLQLAQERLTLVPVSLYFKDGRAKIELAVGRGRRKADKRHDLAERDSQREIERALARRRKGQD